LEKAVNSVFVGIGWEVGLEGLSDDRGSERSNVDGHKYYVRL